jgi:hypothetical protein
VLPLVRVNAWKLAIGGAQDWCRQGQGRRGEQPLLALQGRHQRLRHWRAGSCCRMCNVGQLLVLVHLDPVADVLVAVLHRVQTNTMFESLYTDVQLLRRES